MQRQDCSKDNFIFFLSQVKFLEFLEKVSNQLGNVDWFWVKFPIDHSLGCQWNKFHRCPIIDPSIEFQKWS